MEHKKLLWVIAGGMLALAPLNAFAQRPTATVGDTTTSTTTDRMDRPAVVEEHHTNWGWIGLLGLLGLAGMRGAGRVVDRRDADYRATTNPPTTRRTDV